MSEDKEINEYEALRRAKIARNEARLRELGLHKTPSLSLASATTMKKRSAAVVTPPVPLRRSKRTMRSSLLSSSTDSVRETRGRRRRSADDLPQQNAQEAESPRKRDEDFQPTEHESDDNEDDHPQSIKPRTATRKSTTKLVTTAATTKNMTLSPNSARALQLNLADLFWTGHDDLLGKTLSKTGKAHVMEEAARLGVSRYEMGTPISFNKYSGVQEWGNGVFFCGSI